MPEESLRNIASEPRPRKKVNGVPEPTPQNIIIVILLLALVVLAMYMFKPNWFKKVPGGKTPAKQEQKQEAKASGYSAVFLSNNQVYFGKLEDVSSEYPKLKDVYYLRVERPLQPPPATESAQPDLSLVKLGSELHGPVDEIKFNKQQILFIEELKSDGRVVKAIEEHKNRNK
jgi:hypothetical protein